MCSCIKNGPHMQLGLENVCAHALGIRNVPRASKDPFPKPLLLQHYNTFTILLLQCYKNFTRIIVVVCTTYYNNYFLVHFSPPCNCSRATYYVALKQLHGGLRNPHSCATENKAILSDSSEV